MRRPPVPACFSTTLRNFIWMLAKNCRYSIEDLIDEVTKECGNEDDAKKSIAFMEKAKELVATDNVVRVNKPWEK